MILLLALGHGCSNKSPPEAASVPTEGEAPLDAEQATADEGNFGSTAAADDGRSVRGSKEEGKAYPRAPRTGSVEGGLGGQAGGVSGGRAANMQGDTLEAREAAPRMTEQEPLVLDADEITGNSGLLQALGTSGGGGGSGLGGVSGVGGATSGSLADAFAQAEQAEQAEQAVEGQYPRSAETTEWGGRVWLSNDDAMSLASPQRLLAALDRGRNVRAADIRPHEFLNYFSFDTPRPRGGNTFAVEGSARKTDTDTLTLAIEVAAASPARQPLDLTLVVDRSGSMSDEGKMVFLKRGLGRMVEQLKPGDVVRLVSFDDRVEVPLPHHTVGEDSPEALRQAITNLSPRGSTDLDAGLRRGLALARGGAEGHERRVLLVTDALLNTGTVDPGLVTDIGRAMKEAGVHVSAVGVGADVNDRVLDMLSEKGHGAYVFLGSSAVVDRVFGPMFPSLVNTVAEDVHASLTLPPSLGMKRFYGEEMSRDKADVQAVSMHAGRAQLYLQDLRVADWDAARRDTIGFHLEWTDLDGKRRTSDQTFPVGGLLAADPRDLDKARALMAWTDEITHHARRQGSCGADYATWRKRKASVGNDAELAWLDGLVTRMCGGREPVEPVAVKVKVNTDQPIAEVQLTCAGETWREALGSADTVARFAQASAGQCRVVLVGNTPMVADVVVPSTGGEVRCRVRSGELDCSA